MLNFVKETILLIDDSNDRGFYSIYAQLKVGKKIRVMERVSEDDIHRQIRRNITHIKSDHGTIHT